MPRPQPWAASAIVGIAAKAAIPTSNAVTRFMRASLVWAVQLHRVRYSIRSQPSSPHLDRLDVPETELRKQSIPFNRDLWRVGRYKDFLAQRRKLLAEEANTFLGF
jgi:hypothetical protein